MAMQRKIENKPMAGLLQGDRARLWKHKVNWKVPRETTVDRQPYLQKGSTVHTNYRPRWGLGPWVTSFLFRKPALEESLIVSCQEPSWHEGYCQGLNCPGEQEMAQPSRVPGDTTSYWVCRRLLHKTVVASMRQVFEQRGCMASDVIYGIPQGVGLRVPEPLAAKSWHSH